MVSLNICANSQTLVPGEKHLLRKDRWLPSLLQTMAGSNARRGDAAPLAEVPDQDQGSLRHQCVPEASTENVGAGDSNMEPPASYALAAAPFHEVGSQVQNSRCPCPLPKKEQTQLGGIRFIPTKHMGDVVASPVAAWVPALGEALSTVGVQPAESAKSKVQEELGGVGVCPQPEQPRQPQCVHSMIRPTSSLLLGTRQMQLVPKLVSRVWMQRKQQRFS